MVRFPSNREANASGSQQPRHLLADGHGRDRQILVVGEGVAGAVTAGFLHQAGLDPVLAAGVDGGTRSGQTVLWEPGLAVLERIGLRRPIEQGGTQLAALDCLTAAQSWTAGERAQSTLCTISDTRLQTLLDQHLLDRIRVADRSVETVEPTATGTATGVQATFEQGIEEPFDAVVTTRQSLAPTQHRVTATPTLHRWTFEWPSQLSPPSVPTEAWSDTHAGFSLPTAGGTRVQLVSAGEIPPATALSIERLQRQFGPLFDHNLFAELEGHNLQYSQTPQVQPRSRCEDGVVLVGPAGRASLPGDCLGPTLAVEDAWVLADALAYGPPTVDDALSAYEQRRRDRRTEIAAAVDGTAIDRVSSDLVPVLRQLCRRRTLVFSHVFDRPVPELVQSAPKHL